MKIIDVTLRESVYYGSGIDFEGALDYLHNLVKYISTEDVSYVEFGYINTDEQGGLNYNEDYINSAWEICAGHFKLVAMMHPGKADIAIWREDVIKKISMVRIVVNGDSVPAQVKDYIAYLHRYGVEVSINLAYALNKTKGQLEEMYRISRDYGADYIYFADSSGSAVREDIIYLSQILNSNKGNNQTGLHLHNHLGMAFANALTTIENNVDFTDVSITGAGKGGGNLQTEIFIPYLRKLNNKELTKEFFVNMLMYIRYFDGLIARESIQHEKVFLDSLVGLYKIKLKKQEELEEKASGDITKYISMIVDEFAVV